MNPQSLFEKFAEIYNKGWNSGFWAGMEVGGIIVLTLFLIRGALWLHRNRKGK